MVEYLSHLVVVLGLLCLCGLLLVVFGVLFMLFVAICAFIRDAARKPKEDP